MAATAPWAKGKEQRVQPPVVVLTGAGSGLGAESARVLAAQGATVLALGRDMATLNQVCVACTECTVRVPAQARAQVVRERCMGWETLVLSQLSPACVPLLHLRAFNASP